MRITAAIARAPREPFTIEPLRLESPRADEILVRIGAAGMSRADLLARDGHLPVPLPAVLGREAAGVVEKVGAGVRRFARGERVALTFEPRSPSGEGLVERNLSGFRRDGSSPLSSDGERVAGRFFGQSSFATHALAGEENTVRIAGEAPFPVLAALGGDVQAGAAAVINLLRPQPGSSIAIFGAGAVGLGAVMAARLCGCHPIIAADLKASRLELAEGLGATHGIDPDGLDPIAAIREIAGGGAAFSVEATGLPGTASQAISCLAEGGGCALAGVASTNAEVTLNLFELRRGRILCGSFFGESEPQTFIPRLVELYRRGSFPVDRIISEYRFAEINRAAEDILSGAAVKAVLIMP
jgi:aryl-alcohol dehydrogenase